MMQLKLLTLFSQSGSARFLVVVDILNKFGYLIFERQEWFFFVSKHQTDNYENEVFHWEVCQFWRESYYIVRPFTIFYFVNLTVTFRSTNVYVDYW